MAIAKPIADDRATSDAPSLDAQAQAQRLLAEAGSPDLAKQAIDSAAQEKVVGSPGDKFAAQWGFDSYLSMFEASVPLAPVGGKNWCVTSIGDGRWLLWNDADLVATQYSSREEAERQVGGKAEAVVAETAGLDT